MFTRTGEKTRFDSISLVELEAKQAPVGGDPIIKVRLCYVEAGTGGTYGFIDLTHNAGGGRNVLPPEVLEAWDAFCASVEQFQGTVVFGEGTSIEGASEGKENVDVTHDGRKVGLGGGF